MFQEATLHIEMRDIRLRCRECGTEYSSQDAFGYATCPECGSGASDLLGGKELLLDQLNTLTHRVYIICFIHEFF